MDFFHGGHAPEGDLSLIPDRYVSPVNQKAPADPVAVSGTGNTASLSSGFRASSDFADATTEMTTEERS